MIIKGLVGYLYIAAILSGVISLIYSLFPFGKYFVGWIQGDGSNWSWEAYIFKEGMLLLVSLGILMLAHIGISIAKVFDDEDAADKE